MCVFWYVCVTTYNHLRCTSFVTFHININAIKYANHILGHQNVFFSLAKGYVLWIDVITDKAEKTDPLSGFTSVEC